MADGISTGLVTLINDILTGTTPTVYSTLYAQIHVGAPGSAGTTNISAGSTARQSFSSSSGFATPNVTWTNGGTTETLTDVSLWTASTSGVFLWSAPLGTSKQWFSGDGFEITALTLTFTTAS